MRQSHFPLATVAGAAIAALAPWAGSAVAAGGAVAPASLSGPGPQEAVPTATPIKHLVVIFNENVSFDHYFATYPEATNPPGEPAFTAAPGTPAVDNLGHGASADQQPQLHQHGERRRRRRTVPARSHPGQHRRPEPRLHGRAAGL